MRRWSPWPPSSTRPAHRHGLHAPAPEVGPNDLLVAVRGATTPRCRARRARRGPRRRWPPAPRPAPTSPRRRARSAPPRAAAGRRRWRSSRVPGQYAVAEALDAIAAGRRVLVFSDDVPVEQEIALKDAARRRRRAGDGPRLRHRDRRRRRRSASRTSSGPGRSGWSPRPAPARSRSCACSTWPASGCAHVLGVGGRDLSEAVGGRSTLARARGAGRRPRHRADPLVSKPPAPAVAGDPSAAPPLAERSVPVRSASLGAGRPT